MCNQETKNVNFKFSVHTKQNYKNAFITLFLELLTDIVHKMLS